MNLKPLLVHFLLICLSFILFWIFVGFIPGSLDQMAKKIIKLFFTIGLISLYFIIIQKALKFVPNKSNHKYCCADFNY